MNKIIALMIALGLSTAHSEAMRRNNKQRRFDVTIGALCDRKLTEETAAAVDNVAPMSKNIANNIIAAIITGNLSYLKVALSAANTKQINSVDRDTDRTALMTAAWILDSDAVVAILATKKCNPLVRNNHGQTVFNIMATRHRELIAELAGKTAVERALIQQKIALNVSIFKLIQTAAN